jgi:hypothetical protein
MAETLFSDLSLRGQALRLAWMAFEQAPDRTIEVALASFEGANPAGLFVYKIGQGEHLGGATGGQRRTGWRMAKGTHGVSYVRDPKGVDVLPAGHEQ